MREAASRGPSALADILVSVTVIDFVIKFTVFTVEDSGHIYAANCVTIFGFNRVTLC